MEWHNWLATPREGGGFSRGWLRSPHSQHLGRLESRQTGERIWLGRRRTFLRDRRILTGAARDGVYAVNLKIMARGDWRNAGVIGYPIGREREEIRNTFF